MLFVFEEFPRRELILEMQIKRLEHPLILRARRKIDHEKTKNIKSLNINFILSSLRKGAALEWAMRIEREAERERYTGEDEVERKQN
ncbi:hypothetical protein EVAR_19238_1 [Eumeta japonica]|uniref:Uncharacterized protein n=1 Tax=Eumeta variegata TaxID=151549 RepID=A0A4C1VES3_EUMVA|nr:hypothetical protein EVAR_19238_1 [Eumeta japonica]